jgi:predicted metal-dependent phosphoesterase TrpH
MCNIPLLNRVCLESYNDPLAVYETLKRRGMDFVTVTDHDSIGASESLRRFPDFFLSEEVTCTTPSGTEIHVGVYGIEERHHSELQRRRTDVPALAAYLREQRLFFSINHVFSSLTGRRTARDFELFEDQFPAMETLNGQIPAWNNRSAVQLARDWMKAPVGGSDAHTLESLGFTYTEVPGANSIQDYLQGLRLSEGRVAGASGDYLKLTRAILEIGSRLVGDYRWAITLAPLLLIVPFVTLGNYFSELLFVSKWSRWLAQDRIPAADPLLEAPDAAE